MSGKKSIFDKRRTKKFIFNPKRKDINSYLLDEEYRQTEEYKLLFNDMEMRKRLTDSYHTRCQNELRKVHRNIVRRELNRYKEENLLGYYEFVKALRINGYFIIDKKETKTMTATNNNNEKEEIQKEKLKLFLREFYVGSYQTTLRDMYNSYIDYELNELKEKKTNLMSFKRFAKHLIETNHPATRY